MRWTASILAAALLSSCGPEEPTAPAVYSSFNYRSQAVVGSCQYIYSQNAYGSVYAHQGDCTNCQARLEAALDRHDRAILERLDAMDERLKKIEAQTAYRSMQLEDEPFKGRVENVPCVVVPQ